MLTDSSTVDNGEWTTGIPECQPVPLTEQMTIMTLTVVGFVVGLLLNGVNLIVVVAYWRTLSRYNSNLLVLNVILADVGTLLWSTYSTTSMMLFGCSHTFKDTAISWTDYLGEYFFFVLQDTFYFSSLMSMACLSVERYTIVTRPRQTVQLTARRTVILCFLCWTTSAVLVSFIYAASTISEKTSDYLFAFIAFGRLVIFSVTASFYCKLAWRLWHVEAVVALSDTTRRQARRVAVVLASYSVANSVFITVHCCTIILTLMPFSRPFFHTHHGHFFNESANFFEYYGVELLNGLLLLYLNSEYRQSARNLFKCAKDRLSIICRKSTIRTSTDVVQP